jgi:hypothetical protein
MADSKKGKKNTWKQVLFTIVLTFGGAFLGYGIGYLSSSSNSGNTTSTPWEYKLMLIPVILISFLIVLALHELGHVLAGLSVGFDFRMYTVGPFMIEKEEGKLKFKWNTNLNTFGGLALCLPQSTEGLLPKFIRFAAGGPLMSLVWAMIAFGLTWALPEITNTSLWLYSLSLFLEMSALFSLFIFVVTIIPMKSGGFYSDGGRIFNLWRGGYQAQLEIILLQVMAQSLTGTRPREINIEPLVEALDFPVETSFKAYLHGFLYVYFLDIQDIIKAGEHLEKYYEYLEEIPGGYQAAVWLEKTYYEAMYEQDAVKAREYFDNAIIGAAIPKAQIYRAEAALALIEDRPEVAIQKGKDAIIALPKSMDKGAAIAEKEWIRNIILQAESRIKLLSSPEA